jgi:hypothetical protein
MPFVADCWNFFQHISNTFYGPLGPRLHENHTKRLAQSSPTGQGGKVCLVVDIFQPRSIPLWHEDEAHGRRAGCNRRNRSLHLPPFRCPSIHASYHGPARFIAFELAT